MWINFHLNFDYIPLDFFVFKLNQLVKVIKCNHPNLNLCFLFFISIIQLHFRFICSFMKFIKSLHSIRSGLYCLVFIDLFIDFIKAVKILIDWSILILQVHNRQSLLLDDKYFDPKSCLLVWYFYSFQVCSCGIGLNLNFTH